MARSIREKIKGWLIRGPDGGLYFIRDDQLKPFRMQQHQEKHIKERRDAGGTEDLSFAKVELESVAFVEGPAGDIYFSTTGEFHDD